ncbi:hypothetical protein ACS0TY_016790 [Phlomoides rotata]
MKSDHNKLQHSWKKTKLSIHVLVYRTMNPFMLHIVYFVSLSLIGACILKSLKVRSEFNPRTIDFVFTAVSAATDSSMSTLEMEVFSNSQLILITILMLLGGEVFTSMTALFFNRFKKMNTSDDDSFVKHDSIRFLGFVVLGYFITVQALGIASVLMYLAIFSSARSVLQNKGIKTTTFAIFSIVSSFASCGFIPTNENMMVFRQNSGLLWIFIPQILLGNTLFPAALRLVIWVVGKRRNKLEANYLLDSSREAEYLHLLPRLHSLLSVATLLGFLVIGILLFCLMEWNLAGLNGMSSYQKVVGIVFQCSNARYAGESIVDLSTVAPAILVFFTLMMYLPPYTSFYPVMSDEEQRAVEDQGKREWRKKVAENLVFSQLGYLVIFITLVCITERKSLKEDPLNFSVLNIVFEVISAYGNVGFTTGYSCERQLRAVPKCKNKYYGFCGKWSDEGKIVLIVVMLFGRLKKFNMSGGQAWKLL